MAICTSRRTLFSLLVSFVMSCGVLQADMVVINPSLDNTLYFSTTGTLSNGVGSFFFAGRTNAGQIRRGLLAFDIASSVPAGSTIQSVSLQLNMSRTISGDLPISLHRVLASWGEGNSNANSNEGSGAPAAVGDATWLHRSFGTTLWTTQGGDFSVVASASTIVNLVGNYSWSSPTMVTDVQSWLDSPGSNFGWAVLGDEINNGSAKRFNTREIGDSTIPQLSITFVAVPEPATWLMIVGLAAAACVGLWHVRRQRTQLLAEQVEPAEPC